MKTIRTIPTKAFLFALLSAAALIGTSFVVLSQDVQTHSRTSDQVKSAKSDTTWDPSWPPLPQSGSPAGSLKEIRTAYTYAARRGDILKYIPCYCGCEKEGHKSVEDCFVKERTPEGIKQWDRMGFS